MTNDEQSDLNLLKMAVENGGYVSQYRALSGQDRYTTDLAFLRGVIAQARAEEREECAKIADAAATEAERIGQLHPKGSESRDRMFARSLEAFHIGGEIRARSKP